MINIIICDDNVKDANKVEKIVKDYMYNIEYNIYLYNDFDKNFLKIIDADLANKIYLLDIETPSMSGIDVARRIRKDDYSSVIIFFSGHDDLSRIIAKKNLMALNFINKFDNLKENLKSSLDLALSIVGKKRRVKLYSKGIVYNLDIDKILYITRDTISRKSTIICDNATYEVNISLKNIISELNEDFIQTHRACFVNKNRIKYFDYKNKCITFDNMVSTTLVSKRYVEGASDKC